MIAALPMYDWPVLRPVNDRFWRVIAEHLLAAGIDAPERLTRQDDYGALWLRDDLLLAQTCGLPFNTRLRDRVRYLATPDHVFDGCREGRYSSAIVVGKHADIPGDRADVLAGGRLAINGPDSWSGCVALQHWFHDRDMAMPEPHLVSGGHLFSMQAVADDAADYAAIDSIAFGLASEHLPELRNRLRVVGWTAEKPATPYITALSASDDLVAALRQAIRDAIRAEPQLRRDLGLRGVSGFGEDVYASMRPLQTA